MTHQASANSGVNKSRASRAGLPTRIVIFFTPRWSIRLLTTQRRARHGPFGRVEPGWRTRLEKEANPPLQLLAPSRTGVEHYDSTGTGLLTGWTAGAARKLSSPDKGSREVRAPLPICGRSIP